LLGLWLFFKDLSALRYTAAASLLIVIWIAMVLALFFLRVGPSFEPCSGSSAAELDAEALLMRSELPCGGAGFQPFARDRYGLTKVLPVFVFCFTCQQNIFTISSEAGNR